MQADEGEVDGGEKGWVSICLNRKASLRYVGEGIDVSDMGGGSGKKPT